MRRLFKFKGTTSAACFTVVILTAATSGANARQDLQSQWIGPDRRPFTTASALLRGAAKCARNVRCRKEVARQAKELWKRIVQLATDIALENAEKLYEHLGEIIDAPDHNKALAKLDELEALLKRDGIQCPELKREFEALRQTLKR